jgi:hypothetical protein
LDSRLIFKLSSHIYESDIDWLNRTYENGAWIYIVDGDELMKEFIFKKINDHFTDETLYIVLSRNDSRIISKKETESGIEDILGKRDFQIWDTEFKKVAEFKYTNCIMRLGIKRETENI